MDETICRAIATKSLLTFTYKGFDRVVEPHACGVLKTGNEALRAFQVGGGSESGNSTGWKLMLLDEIEDLSIVDEQFSSPRTGYRRGDSAMDRIYCEI